MIRAYGAVAESCRNVVFREVSVPDPGAEDVVVRVEYSWISNGTESSFIRGERIGGDTPRLPTDPMPFPHISGYQKVGVVESVGSKVDASRVQVGDRVFATISRVLNMFYDHAGHISPAVTHQSQVYRLPDGVDSLDYSGLVLTQVGYNVGTCGEIAQGDAAIVIGDGMVGHWSAQTLQTRGARVMLLGRHNSRLALFKCATGDCCVNETTQDVAAAIKQWAPNGVQFVADTVGSIDSMYSLMPHMRHSGHLVSAGFYGNNGLIDIQRMRMKELSLHAPAGWSPSRLEATMDLIHKGELTTRHLITSIVPASQAGAAFNSILNKDPGVLGVVLDWREVNG